ncbi:conserved hypothetical protein [Burkholderia sp. 8Y]|uniref:hypothetical protein n=1 Tax=Burkholderia sp. 8Y TaxID=2653133 RepID=UPI0012F1E69E|nr:hypothetical protein [Burkholderia sp. 8Y]VXB24547.1 conserved hypothetical protein [Burkholderia sp. 8Y]
MAHQKKATPDWERIEADYRAGILSVREIAASQGISHVAIAKRAKRDGWDRDLAKRIQAKAEALVTTRTVTTEVTSEQAVTDRVIVEANAEVIANIRLAHRSDIARSRRLAMALLGELESVTENRELFEELGIMLRSEDERGNDKRNDLYQKVISMSGRVSNMKQLSETLKTLVGLEREAYGITGAHDGGGTEAPAGLDHFYAGSDEQGDA